MKRLIIFILALGILSIPSQVEAQEVTVCDADIDENGIVDILDYSILTANFFLEIPTDARANLNPQADGKVDLLDYSILVSFFSDTCPRVTPTASPQYGPQEVVGPQGAIERTCTGISNCVVCSTTSCTNGKSWGTAIAQAAPGETVLLKGGDYQSTQSVSVPKGTSSQPIVIARYGNEIPRLQAMLDFCSGDCGSAGNVSIEGLQIDVPQTIDFAIKIQGNTGSAQVRNVGLNHMQVRGGRIEAIRIRGKVDNVTIQNSSLDGGYENHVVKVMCDDPSDEPSTCTRVPENISFIGNEFSKNKSEFFPKATCGDETLGGSGDLIQLEGAGTVSIVQNNFGHNNYEDCLDIKGEGRVGADLTIRQNLIDSTGENSDACTLEFSGCRSEGLILHGSQHSGDVNISENHFVGGGNLFRTGGDQVNVSSNDFDNTRVRIETSLFSFFDNLYGNGASCSKPAGFNCL